MKPSEAMPGSDHRKVPTPTTKEGNAMAVRRGEQKTGGLNWDTSNFTSNPDTFGGLWACKIY